MKGSIDVLYENTIYVKLCEDDRPQKFGWDEYFKHSWSAKIDQCKNWFTLNYKKNIHLSYSKCQEKKNKVKELKEER